VSVVQTCALPISDNGNHILDVHNLKILNPLDLEKTINNIVGVVSNGLFASRAADILIVGGTNGVTVKKPN